MNKVSILSGKFKKDLATYFVGNVLNATIPFILLPILTRLLTQEEYGEVTMFVLLVGLLNAFIGVNTHAFVTRKYYDLVSEKNKKDANNSSIIIWIISFVFILMMLMIFDSTFSYIFGLSRSQLVLASLSSAFIFLINFRLAHWQVRKKVTQYTIFQFSLAFANLFFTLILLFYFFNGSQSRIDAYAMSTVLLGIFGFILILKDNLLSFELPSKLIFTEALKFGTPLIFHLAGSFLLVAADRVVINEVMSLADVGIYMVAIQVSLVLNVTFSAVNKAYVPWLFELLSKISKDINLKIIRVTLLYFALLIVIAILGFYLAPILLKVIVGDNFKEAADLVGYIILGQCFFGAYLMVTNYIFFVKKTYFLALITVTCGLLNLILLYFMTIKFGLLGAAYSYIIATTFRFILTAILSNKLFPMPWKEGLISLFIKR